MIYSRFKVRNKESHFCLAIRDVIIASLRYPLVLLIALLGVACSDGEKGPNGVPAEPGNPQVIFNSASVSEQGVLTVELSVEDDAGLPYAALDSSRVRFTVAKLNAAGALGAGESSSWQSYVNRTEAAPSDPSKGSGTVDKIQANSESDGVFTNHGDGSYSYVFNTNLKTVTAPLAVTYDEHATHRVAIQISGGDLPVENATYDWLPATGSAANLITRNIVSSETCNTCHGDLAIHGGGRKDTSYCVTCHNPGSADANSGNTVDFKVMIHKIHRGADLPSVVAGGDYSIWGFNDSQHDYSEVGFPQDIRNCRNCHDENSEATADAKNWILNPTIEACGSCHDDVNFVTGANHEAGAQDNASCSTCHLSGELRADNAHDISGYQIATEQLAVRVDAAAIDPTNLDIQLTFSLINSADGSVYTQPIADMDFLERARLYRNPVVLTEGYVDGATYFDLTSATPIGTNQYSLDTNVALAENQILAFSTGIRLCADSKTGSLLECDDAAAVNVGATATWGNVDESGVLLAPENQLQMGADYERCASCHADPAFSVHGGDYSSLQQCRACHNNSFLSGRGNLDFKFVIHALHAGNLDDGDGAKESMRYPDDIANCSHCHSSAQVNLPIAANKWAPETADGLYTSSIAFVCASCHVTTQPGAIDLNDLAALPAADQVVLNHMKINNAVFNGTQNAANVVETCTNCHASGELFAIDEEHLLDD